MVIRDSKVHNFASSLFFFLIIIMSVRLVVMKWAVCMSKSHRSWCVSFSKTDAGLPIYHLFVWSNLNFLHNSQQFTLSTQSGPVLYSFCANLQHSLIKWFMVSSLSPHSLYLLFCCFLSIPAFIWLVLMAFFYTIIKRDSVSFLRLPFLSYVHVFWLEMLLISHLKRPWNCFCSHFCFLVIVVQLVLVLFVLYLVAVISLSLRFCM